jgi:hypothetical protein
VSIGKQKYQLKHPNTITMKFHLKKIISGGQTGVDVGALEAAMSVGLACGGWCPPDRRNEDGPIPEKFGLIPTEMDRSDLAVEIPRSRRTECNIMDSDGSLVIGRTGYSYGPGTAITVGLANIYGKPVFKLWLPENDATVEVAKWIQEHHVHTLNVAGPSETEAPGMQQLTYEFVIGLWKQLVKLQTE